MKVKVREMKEIYPLNHYSNVPKSQLSKAEGRSPELHFGLFLGQHSPRIWTITCCLHRCISRDSPLSAIFTRAVSDSWMSSRRDDVLTSHQVGEATATSTSCTLLSSNTFCKQDTQSCLDKTRQS